MLIGTAKPRPMFPSARPFVKIIVLMPMTSPRRLSSGPPELPGLIAASVWSISFVRPSVVNGALRRADHADRHRPALVERVADRHHPVAGGHLRRVAELGFRQRMVRLFGQLNQRAVGQRVLADQLGGIGLIVVLAEERHFDLGRVLDDVIVREDQAVLADDEPGAGGDRRLLARRRGSAAALPALPRGGGVLLVGIAAAGGWPKKRWKKIVGDCPPPHRRRRSPRGPDPAASTRSGC